MKNHKEILLKYFGYREYRSGQKEAIDSVLLKKDTLVVMPTGIGKSICYQIPGLIFKGITLVITPLISLMKDQVDNLKKIKINATFINSTLDSGEIQNRISDIRNYRYKFVYVSPERLESSSFRAFLKELNISLLAVDEAHCISEWGHDFRPSYLKISETINYLNHPPVIALTATATKLVQKDIIDQLKMVNPNKIITGFARSNLSLSVFSEVEKLEKIKEVILGVGGSGIIYTATRKNSETISKYLDTLNIPARPYHAGLDEKERTRIQEGFLKDKVRIVCATSAFGLGIDKKNVRYVIHYDIPSSLEQYYQEIGRAGRDEKKSYCVLLYNKNDRKIQEFFIYNSHPTKEQICNIYDFLYDYTNTAIGNSYIDPVYLSTEDIQKMKPELNSILIDSILKILEEYDLIQRFISNQIYPRIKFLVSPDKLKQYSQITPSEKLKIVINNLLRYPGNEATFRNVNFDPKKFLEISALKKADFLNLISILQNSGYLRFIPPVKGKGLFLLHPRATSKYLDIDYKKIQKKLFLNLKKLNVMEEYTQLTTCRRNFILNYFGENDITGNCGICDLCLGRHQNKKTNFKNDAIKLLIINIINELKIFSIKTLSEFLTGEKTVFNLSHNLISHKYFGILEYYSNKMIVEYIYSLLNENSITKKTRNKYILSVTQKGFDFLQNSNDLFIAVPNTVYSTYILCKDGLNMYDIAKKRNLTETTISKHIEELINNNFDIDPLLFIPQKILEDLLKIFDRFGIEDLKTIKENYQNEITIMDLRIVRAIYIKKKKLSARSI